MRLLVQPPGYRRAESRSQRCGNCGAFKAYVWCRMFSRPVDAGKVCDRWYPRP